MQARRAARELAFILFSQIDKDINKFTKADFSNIVLKSVRTLKSNATDELQIALSSLMEFKAEVEDYEANHETNLNRPLDVSNIPVPMILTSDLSEKISGLIDAAEKSLLALEIAEFTTLDAQNEVQEFAIEIAEQYKEHNAELDEIMQKYSKNWDLQRLVTMDKNILRIALIELLYIKQTPLKVVIDEALELAKKYSTDESTTFINGILAKVVVDYGIE
ncbi:MAG: transcription antitermination factor NusB [Fusobacterium sp.]|nr:transcription antitermination factor NusB [Fusobacterium sp.]